MYSMLLVSNMTVALLEGEPISYHFVIPGEQELAGELEVKVVLK